MRTNCTHSHREKAYFKEVIRTICENGGDPVDKDELTALRVQVGGTAPYTRVCAPRVGKEVRED